MSNCVVVGGGVAGLYSSILAAEHYDSVTLVEASSQCGGLLKSWKNDLGLSFDFGTHILSETSNDEINAVLFKGIYENPDLWNSYDVTKVSNSFAGKLYDQAQFIALHHLTDDDYKLALAELVMAPGLSIDSANNLYEYSLRNYGSCITEKVLRPLFRKMQRAELEDLHPYIHFIFAFNRFILGDKKLSQDLKTIDKFDQKLAFSSYYDGLSGAKKFYPKSNKGIELWIEYLCEQAQQKGVTFKLNSQVKELAYSKGLVKSIRLSNDYTLSCDHVIWTIPPIFAINATGVKFTSTNKPEFCPMSLHHLVFDQPFLDKNYYSNINEPECDGFRVTFYPNLQDDYQGKFYHCTVEVLFSDYEGLALSSQIASELKQLGYVHNKANLVKSDYQNVPMGFPKFTNLFIDEKCRQIDFLNSLLSNITLVGKSSRTEFFVYGILQEVYDSMTKQFNYE